MIPVLWSPHLETMLAIMYPERASSQKRKRS